MEECISYIKSQASCLLDVQELIDLAVRERDTLGPSEVADLRELSLDQLNLAKIEQQKKLRRPGRLVRLFQLVNPTVRQLRELHLGVLVRYKREHAADVKKQKEVMMKKQQQGGGGGAGSPLSVPLVILTSPLLKDGLLQVGVLSH